MAIKAIICDLDRTLLRTDKTVSDRTVSVLAACRRQGILLMAATARPVRAIADYQHLLGFDAVTTLNGAVIVLPGETRCNGISRQTALGIAAQLAAMDDAVISLQTADGLFANTGIPEWEPAVYSDLSAAPLPQEVYKLLVSSARHDPGAILRAALPEDTYFTVANGDLYQVMSRQATKWNGIRQMLETFSVDWNDAVCFGDDQDDLEPIIRCGTGVAVANAIPAVLGAADFVTGSNDEDGVAAYLEKHILYPERS